MIKAPVVSVIMTVRNGARFLRECLDSVRQQTFSDYELIVVDDGSTDNSRDILREYASKDSRATVIEEDHRGIAAARNLALNRASCALVAIMDADDRMMPNRLARQIEFFKGHPEAAAVCSYARLIDVRGRGIGYSRHDIEIDAGLEKLAPALFLEIVNPSVMVRRSIILSLGGYNQHLSRLSDRELWGRFVTAGHRIVCQKECLMEYRLHLDSVTARSGGSGIGQLIDFNIVCRLRGDPEVPYTHLEEWNRTRSVTERLRTLSISHYKDATRQYGEGNWARCGWLTLFAFVLSPSVVFKRLVDRLGTSRTASPA